jgi:hypothetical protein
VSLLYNKNKNIKKEKLKKKKSRVLMAHACNPSYSGDRDQEDRSSKPAQTNRSRRPYLKKSLHKKGLAEWLKVKALSLSPGTKKERGGGEEGR